MLDVQCRHALPAGVVIWGDDDRIVSGSAQSADQAGAEIDDIPRAVGGDDDLALDGVWPVRH
jgi:hypothetical protein